MRNYLKALVMVIFVVYVMAFNYGGCGGGGGGGGDDTGDSGPTIAPSAPTSLTAQPVSASQIDLTWADNSNNEAGFKIERKIGSTGTYAQIAIVAANTIAYSDTGLTAGTSYYYQLRAYNSIGNSSYSSEVSASTQAAAGTPSAPSGLTANAVSSSWIELNWLDNATDEEGFSIERKTGSGGTYQEIAAVTPNIIHYSDSGLTDSTTYFYRIRAYNALGNSNYSGESFSTTEANWAPVFTKTWGGPNNEMPDALSYLDSSDNIYIIGHTESFTTTGIIPYMLKYNSSGTLQYQKSISNIDSAYGIVDASGNMVLGLNNASNLSYYLLKLNSTGTITWQKNGSLTPIGIDLSGNIYCIGNGDVIAKLDANGNIIWQKTCSAGIQDAAVDSAGNMVIRAMGSNNGLLLVKIDTNGNIVWQKYSTMYASSYFPSVQITSLGNILINTGGYFFKLDSNGNVIFSQVLEAGETVAAEDSSGNTYVLSWTRYYGSDSADLLLVKYSAGGTVLWSKTWGGNDAENPIGIKTDTASGNIYVVGNTYSFGADNIAPFILKYDSNGNLLEQKIWNSPAYTAAKTFIIGGSNIYLVGQTTGYTGQGETVTGAINTPRISADADIVLTNSTSVTLSNASLTLTNSSLTLDTPSGVGTGAGGADMLLLGIGK